MRSKKLLKAKKKGKSKSKQSFEKSISGIMKNIDKKDKEMSAKIGKILNSADKF